MEYDTPAYYLKSSIKPSTVLLPPSRRTYEMFVNPQLFNQTFGTESISQITQQTHSLIDPQVQMLLLWNQSSLTNSITFWITLT